MTHTLYHGDCLDILPTLPAQSVDAIIADPPYGTTACKWDSVIPLDAMWRELKRVVKPRGAVVLFAAQPFTSALVMSNVKWFRYVWVWDKNTPTGFLNAKRAPLKQHEDVCVFSASGHTYNYQKELKSYRGYRSSEKHAQKNIPEGVYGNDLVTKGDRSDYRYPKTILHFQGCGGWAGRKAEHPTQKPVELLRYLVCTYTNPGETVLDFTMGSGTTGVACAMEGRHFIGVELDAGYFDIARKRIESVQSAAP